ncbi:hypothetical protein HOLleu_38799 [Holothuria leucospilota]|uniref:Uncharacterized protein n=1 Tax=Holothuria leucospilota TaxID=206669 RepID=A0A9Q0YHQ8_HOLLE|nr:hypothetical protein HOLleu_38799 [Holothuria leucospilota]
MMPRLLQLENGTCKLNTTIQTPLQRSIQEKAVESMNYQGGYHDTKTGEEQ